MCYWIIDLFEHMIWKEDKERIQHTMTTVDAYGVTFFLYNSVILMIKSNDFTVSSLNVLYLPEHSFRKPKTPPSSFNTLSIAKSVCESSKKFFIQI